MRTSILTLLILFMYGRLVAQDDINGIIVGKAKVYDSKIALRWNITNYQLLKQLTTNGVHIDRLTLNSENQPESNGWQRITTEPLSAWPLQKIRNSKYSNDTSVAVIAEGLYGTITYPKDLNLIEKINYQDLDKQNRYVAVSLYAALSADAAKIAALGYDDVLIPDVKKAYVYRITPIGSKNIIGNIEPGFIYVSGADLNIKQPPTPLKAESAEHAVVLNWPVKRSPFTGYFVQRSTDGKNFKDLDETIYLPDASDTTGTNPQYSYYDSVSNYVPYHYRIYGVDAFGDKSLFSDTVVGMGKDFTPPTPPEFAVKKDKKKLSFSWEKIVEPDIKGYLILKGKTIDAREDVVTNDILPAKTEKYELTLPDKFNSSYYRLMCIDTAGNFSLSNAVYIFEPDSIPPAAPIVLRGDIDTLGTVSITWALDRSDEAIRGYKVYMANQDDHQYIPVLDMVKDTTATFSIDLNSLTKNVFVKVAAIDGSFNHSDLSKTLVLKRPDIIPPVAPELLDFKNDKTGIELRWSSYQSNDLFTNILYRRSDEKEEWAEIFRSKNTFKYLDKNVKAGTGYYYTLRALDSSGLYSNYAVSLFIRTSTLNGSDKLNLKGIYSKNDKIVTLSWQKSKEQVQYFILYKDTGEGLSLYKSLPAERLTFSETGSAIPKGKYAIKIKYLDNRESELFICQ